MFIVTKVTKDDIITDTETHKKLTFRDLLTNTLFMWQSTSDHQDHYLCIKTHPFRYAKFRTSCWMMSEVFATNKHSYEIKMIDDPVVTISEINVQVMLHDGLFQSWGYHKEITNHYTGQIVYEMFNTIHFPLPIYKFIELDIGKIFMYTADNLIFMKISPDQSLCLRTLLLTPFDADTGVSPVDASVLMFYYITAKTM